jgi:hypothetical protein
VSALSLPVSFGEAADKLTILEIKRERIVDPAKLANIEAELRVVQQRLFEHTGEVTGFTELFERLKGINARLWDIEEGVRSHERRGDFGAEFIRLARAVYRTNDERTRVKRELDILFHSAIVEEKSYVDYPPTDG